MADPYMPRLRLKRDPRWQASVSLVLLSLWALAQTPSQSANLQGIIRDSDGKPVAEAAVVLERNDSADTLRVQTDAQGNYTFAKVPEGVYVLRATKNGFVGARLPSVLLRRNESQTVDLTLAGQHASLAAGPQFSDQPQFSIAGVTDTTNLGGHGSDVVVRTRDSLAKETVQLAEDSINAPADRAREESLRNLADRQPPDVSASQQLGHLLVARGRGREAIRFLELAHAGDPANYETAYDLAVANYQAGNNALAREEARALLPANDKAELHHLLGDVEEKLGDSLESVRQYQRAAELEPSEPNLFDWGAELLLHHAPEPAQEVFAKGSRMFPSSPRMLLGLGAASFARGANEEAVQRVCQASDLNPNDSVPYLFLGKIEQTEIAPSAELVQKLRRFVTLHPQSADANYYYAVGLWKLRKSALAPSLTEVESLLKTAEGIDPKHAAAALQLGIVHADRGSYAEAISDYRRALEADPQMEEAHYRLAQAYREVGQPEKAKEELRLYAQLTKESSQQQEREHHEIKQFVYTLRDKPAPAR